MTNWFSMWSLRETISHECGSAVASDGWLLKVGRNVR